MRMMLRNLAAVLLTAMTLSAADATLPQLQQMMAKFAPVDLRVDTSKLSVGDRAALVKLIDASRVVNHIFLEQMWSRQSRALREAEARPDAARKSAAGILSGSEQRAVVRSGRSQGVSPGRAGAQAAGRGLLSGEHDTRTVRNLGKDAVRGGAKAGAKGFFTVIRAGFERQAEAQSRIPRFTRRIWRSARRTCGSGATDRQRQPETLSRNAGSGFPFERLLRERRGVDGSGRTHRYHNRAVRNV